MKPEDENQSVSGVPKQVFEQFLTSLTVEGVSGDVTERLKRALIEEGDISEAAIREALFPSTISDS